MFDHSMVKEDRLPSAVIASSICTGTPGGVGGVSGNTTLPTPPPAPNVVESLRGYTPPKRFNMDGFEIHPDEVEGVDAPKNWKMEPRAELTVDWITCTFRDKRILDHLQDIRPLTPLDLKAASREDPEENQYIDVGLKSTKVSVPFWRKTFKWFEGGTVSIGAIGGQYHKGKDEMVMIKLPGKALAWVRQFTSMNELTLLQWIWQFMEPKSPPPPELFDIDGRLKKGEQLTEDQKERGHFTRIDWTIDWLPGREGFHLIETARDALLGGDFTSTWDRKKAKYGLNVNGLKIVDDVEYDEHGKGRIVPGSISIGRRDSETFARIYNKRREIIERGGKDPGFEWHRFELEKKGDQAHLSVKRALEGFAWRIRILGLFQKHTHFRDSENLNSRIERSPTAPWFVEVLRGAEYEPLYRPHAQEKPFVEYRNTTLKQCSKRLAKVLATEALSTGTLKNFFKDLIAQTKQAMTPDDYRQFFRFFFEEAGVEEKKDSVENMVEFVNQQLEKCA